MNVLFLISRKHVIVAALKPIHAFPQATGSLCSVGIDTIYVLKESPSVVVVLRDFLHEWVLNFISYFGIWS